jgi:hypothetical protein
LDDLYQQQICKYDGQFINGVFLGCGYSFKTGDTPLYTPLYPQFVAVLMGKYGMKMMVVVVVKEFNQLMVVDES